MSELSQKTCEACRIDAPKATDVEIKTFLASYPHWTLRDDDGTQKLQQVYSFTDFEAALAFTMPLVPLPRMKGIILLF